MAAERIRRRRAEDTPIPMEETEGTPQPPLSRSQSEGSWTLPTEFGGSAAQAPAVGDAGAAAAAAPSGPASSGSSGHGRFPGGGGGPEDPDPSAGRGRAEIPWLRGENHSGCDAKLLEKPGHYAGDLTTWRGWKQDVESYLTAVDGRFERALPEAASVPTKISLAMVPRHLVMLGRFLFAFLLGLLGGVLHEIVAGVEAHNGWEGWRAINYEMEPRAGTGRLNALERLLEPDLDGDFHRKRLA